MPFTFRARSRADHDVLRHRLQAFLVEVNELVKVLEGGDARLLRRLKTGSREVLFSSFRSAPASTTEWRFESVTLPISVLRIFERAFTAQETGRTHALGRARTLSSYRSCERRLPAYWNCLN